MAKQVVYCCQIEVHFTGIFRSKRCYFQVYDHVATQFDMVEQQVKAECFAANFDRILLAKERETGAKLDQELSDVRNQSPLEFLFCRRPLR